MTSEKTFMVALGRSTAERSGVWQEAGNIDGEVRFNHAVPSGRRFGQRAFGLGVDAIIVAVKARLTVGSAFVVCMNPWIAVALRLTGFTNFAVTGIYATPGSRSWRILRKAIGNRPVISLVETEAAAWRESGGRASAILYGNTFDYPVNVASSDFRTIFVGGTSDRDPVVLDRLVSQVKDDKFPVRLVIADGSGPRSWHGTQARVEWLAQIAPSEFGRQMSFADVVFIPLVDSPRSAGHMVMVGSLECGIPVVTTLAGGVAGYVDGEFVRTVRPESDYLCELIAVAETLESGRERVRRYWTENFSLPMYAARVCVAIDSLVEDSDG